jgi:hypothetical protein
LRQRGWQHACEIDRIDRALGGCTLADRQSLKQVKQPRSTL